MEQLREGSARIRPSNFLNCQQKEAWHRTCNDIPEAEGFGIGSAAVGGVAKVLSDIHETLKRIEQHANSAK